MSEQSMIERVARALIQDEYDGGRLGGAEILACIEEDWRLKSRREAFIRKARAAIEAMREPPVALYNAAMVEPMEHYGAWWDAMISAALQSSGE